MTHLMDIAEIKRLIDEGKIEYVKIGASELAQEYIGADFVEHFVATRRWEVKEYEKAVTNWDRRRYLELI
jgi:glutamine synthetase